LFPLFAFVGANLQVVRAYLLALAVVDFERYPELTILIPHPLPPVVSINIKTKELGGIIVASISKQGTYKSFVLIFLYALL
jgi:hypothetical protein